MALKANDFQYGGDHYQAASYQHWDMVIHTGINYLQGCASKYVSRWRRKGGLVDLKKARHYVQKADEAYGTRLLEVGRQRDIVDTFIDANKLTPAEADAIRYIVDGDWARAGPAIEALIANAEAELSKQQESER